MTIQGVSQANEAGFISHIGHTQLNKEAGIANLSWSRLCRGTVGQAVNMAEWDGRVEATVTVFCIQSTFALRPQGDFAIPSLT